MLRPEFDGCSHQVFTQIHPNTATHGGPWNPRGAMFLLCTPKCAPGSGGRKGLVGSLVDSSLSSHSGFDMSRPSQPLTPRVFGPPICSNFKVHEPLGSERVSPLRRKHGPRLDRGPQGVPRLPTAATGDGREGGHVRGAAVDLEGCFGVEIRRRSVHFCSFWLERNGLSVV